MSPNTTKSGSAALLLFFLSGFAALVYETVWTRQLVLVFGATLTSATTVLAGFMAGMALGALWGSRLTQKTHDPLRLYGKLELGIAAWAAAFPWVIKLILAFIEKSDLPIGPVRLILIFAALLPATTLMGLTFPVLSRLNESNDPGHHVGNLYAANLIGSCLGALATAYVLLAFLGLSGSHWLAVAINVAVGLTALSFRREQAPAAASAASKPAPWQAFACLFVSGLCGMALEVIWIRILMPSFNNSAYGFACVIFVFLLGLGGGSFTAARLPALGFQALGGLQILAALYAYVGYRLFEIAELVQIRLGTMGPSTIMPVILPPAIETLLILLPLAVLQGMLLPMAVRLIAGRDEAGPATGRLYFWNTLGGIAGALLAGFWWVPSFNVQNALLVTMFLSAACGAALVAWALPRRPARYGVPALAAFVFAVMVLSLRGQHLPEKSLLDWINRGGGEELAFYADGAEASVAVPKWNRRLIINGVGVTGYSKATKMLAHLPLLLHPDPKRVLIICFGMGTTFRSALTHPVNVEVVDLVPAVFETFPLFYPDAASRLADPRAAHFADDGRNHLLRARRGYDIIISDPSPPLYAAGTVNLYSREFFELAARHLNPGGILAVWLPEYPEPDFKMVMKSFISAVPHSQMWLGTTEKGGLIMLGSQTPLPADHALVRARLKNAGVQADLRERDPGFGGEKAFWSFFIGSGESQRAYLADSPEITDDFPRLEYPFFRSKTPAYSKHPSVLQIALASH
ncbi:MAG: fused MFS/spermidine synthase [Elusimicrobiota bacterium]